MNFKEIMYQLDDFTRGPANGDYDEHCHNAMKAVYDLMKHTKDIQLLRIGHLVRKLSISKSAIRKLMAEGEFPKPIRIGRNIDVWNQKTVNEWFETKEGSVLPKPDLSHDSIGQ